MKLAARDCRLKAVYEKKMKASKAIISVCLEVKVMRKAAAFKSPPPGKKQGFSGDALSLYSPTVN